MLLVAGYSGIGKSALVHEVQRPIVEARGHFISGKFDQLARNVPYASLIQAFREITRQLLAEPAEVLQDVRHRVAVVIVRVHRTERDVNWSVDHGRPFVAGEIRWLAVPEMKVVEFARLWRFAFPQRESESAQHRGICRDEQQIIDVERFIDRLDHDRVRVPRVAAG